VGTALLGPQLRIWFAWKRTGYDYPNPIPKDFKAEHSGAAVYPLAIYPPASADPTAQYVGETEDLARRLRQYLRPRKTQRTEWRVKEYLDDQLKKGARIELHTFDFERFEILIGEDSVLVSTFELFDQFKRKMMENFAILAKPRNCTILNLAIDPISKKLRKAGKVRKLLRSAEGRRQLLQDRDVKTILDIAKRRGHHPNKSPRSEKP
jgi:hypothetical protein